MKEIEEIKLDEEQIQEIYIWIDKIPLSREKRNIYRDFSDGVLIAEITKHFHPKMVSLHNYPQAHSFKQKFTNWDTLNRKVLKRINCVLSETQIKGIINIEQGYIEKFLYFLKPRLENFKFARNSSKILNLHKNRPNNYSELKSYKQKSNFKNKILNVDYKKQILVEDKKSGKKKIRGKSKKKKINKILKENRTDVNEVIKNKDMQIDNLNEAVDILQLKIRKLEELICIKDQRIKELIEN